MNVQQKLVLHPKCGLSLRTYFPPLCECSIKQQLLAGSFSRTHCTCTNTALLWQIWLNTHFGEPDLNTTWDGIFNRPGQAGERSRILEKYGALCTTLWNLLYSLVFNKFFWKFHITEGHLLNFWAPKGQDSNMAATSIQANSDISTWTSRAHSGFGWRSTSELSEGLWGTLRMVEDFCNRLNRGNGPRGIFFFIEAMLFKIISQKIL